MVWIAPARREQAVVTPEQPEAWSTQPVVVGRRYRVRLTRTQYAVEHFSFTEEDFVEVEAENEDAARDAAQEMLDDRENPGDWERVGDNTYHDTDYDDTDNYEVDADSIEQI